MPSPPLLIIWLLIDLIKNNYIHEKYKGHFGCILVLTYGSLVIFQFENYFFIPRFILDILDFRFKFLDKFLFLDY